MDELTPRQIQILKSIVDEYTQTAVPVGSEVLEKKYNLGVSPATIRNEMVALTSGGYLKQPHTSAGRIPTPRALKFYVDQLMEEKQLSVAEEVAAKERILAAKEDFDGLMHEATKALAEATQSLALAATEKGHVWHAGYTNIFDIPEFYNIDVTTQVFSLLEEMNKLQELFFKRVTGEDPIDIFFGEELGWRNFEPVGIVAAHFESPEGKGRIGIVGPARLDYSSVIPTIRYFSELLNEIGKSWQQR